MNSVALGLARQIRDGERSASAVLEATLARIREADPRYHCFTSVTETRARQEAAAIDARRARGEVLPPLAGVPYAVKNLFDTADEVTLAGGRVNAANPPARRDAVLVARLREAGQTILVIDKYVERLLSLADQHVILERGKVVWTGDSPALDADRGLWERYLGV